MNQLAIDWDADPRQLARTTDPLTSHVAAGRVRQFAASHENVILACLQDHGPQTKDEIAKRTRLTDIQVARRLKVMAPHDPKDNPHGKGLIELTGTTRLSLCGVPERVWRAIQPRTNEGSTDRGNIPATKDHGLPPADGSRSGPDERDQGEGG